jgi:hypothetical protein
MVPMVLTEAMHPQAHIPVAFSCRELAQRMASRVLVVRVEKAVVVALAKMAFSATQVPVQAVAVVVAEVRVVKEVQQQQVVAHHMAFTSSITEPTGRSMQVMSNPVQQVWEDKEAQEERVVQEELVATEARLTQTMWVVAVMAGMGAMGVMVAMAGMVLMGKRWLFTSMVTLLPLPIRISTSTTNLRSRLKT